MNTISILAGISAVLLVIEALVVMIIVGAAVYFIRRGIRIGRREASPYVQQVIEQVYRAEALTKDYSTMIVSPQVEAISTLRGIRRGLGALFEQAGPDSQGDA